MDVLGANQFRPVVCSKRWCGFDGDGAAVFPFDAALPFVADEFAFSQET